VLSVVPWVDEEHVGGKKTTAGEAAVDHPGRTTGGGTVCDAVTMLTLGCYGWCMQHGRCNHAPIYRNKERGRDRPLRACAY
jgi:hypothetical protein